MLCRCRTVRPDKTASIRLSSLPGTQSLDLPGTKCSQKVFKFRGLYRRAPARFGSSPKRSRASKGQGPGATGGPRIGADV